MRRPGVRGSIFAALDGAALTIPITLGSVTLIFSKVGGNIMPAAIVTTLFALALLQVITANGRRPLLYSARFFEATALAAMMDRAIELIPDWGVKDTPQMRLAILCAIIALAGMLVGVLFALRADRFSRHIPTPVFAAFSNSIALGLLIAGAGTLRQLWAQQGLASSLLVGGVSFGSGVIIRQWLPRWPSAAVSLVLGLALGAVLHTSGGRVVMTGEAASHWAVTAAWADYAGLARGAWSSAPMCIWLFANACILSMMMFINTSITAQGVSHIDDRPRETGRRLLIASAWLGVAGAAGAAPLSASLQSFTAASKHSRLDTRVLLFTAIIIAGIAASGLLSIVPLAAVVGALACEAMYMIDRPSLLLLRSWLSRKRLSRQQREDLALIVLVTSTGVILNMVAAVISGLLLGLLLFASRHLIPPVKAVWDGTQVASNCARSRADVELLTAKAREIRIFELQGDLFFGTVDALDHALRGAIHDSRCIVIDWSAVRHADTSAVGALAKFQRAAAAAAVTVFHVEPSLSSAELADVLSPVLKPGTVAPDLDRALELAENHVLQSAYGPRQSTSVLESMALFGGMDEDERNTLEAAMHQRIVHAGDAIVNAGEPGDELMVMLQGSASVMVPGAAGQMVRVAGLRRGAVLGEVSFLDEAPRSATVVANDEVLVAVLNREGYARLSVEQPHIVQKLLSNIAMYLAARLRQTTSLAAAHRNRQRTSQR